MRTSKGLAIGLAVLALMLVVTNSSIAAIAPVGDAHEIGSWTQRFEESEVGTFDRIEVFFQGGGDSFEGPGLANFSSTGWIISASSGPSSGPSYVLAQGPGLTSLQFDVLFLGNVTDPVTFDFHAWNGTDSVEAARLAWDGGTWTITTTGDCVRPVPEPTTMIAGALLSFGVSTLRILRKKRAV
jgi:hypothetical protein